jgi:N-methylhydantoinase B
MYSGRDTRPGKNNEWFQLFQIGFGGIPGKPFGDGPDGHSLWPGFTNVPNEFLERYFPLRIERYEALPDTGGAGLNRGGNGIHMSYRFLAAGTVSIHDDRWFTYPWGVNGGNPGSRARKVLEKPDGTQTIVANKLDSLDVEADDVLHFITWGGGGWGDPLQRDPALVAKEIRQGLVTVAGARAYGVVIATDGSVDADATTALRAEMAAAVVPGTDLFNFGGDVETLRAACLAETGLPAPRPPVWHNQPLAIAAE